MPQIEIAVPELDLGLEQLLGLSQPGLLELSKRPENVREIIVEGKMPSHNVGLHKNGGSPTGFFDQPRHVVYETLWIPDLETDVPCFLKLSMVRHGDLPH
jgi:hypothetical protein